MESYPNNEHGFLVVLKQGIDESCLENLTCFVTSVFRRRSLSPHCIQTIPLHLTRLSSPCRPHVSGRAGRLVLRVPAEGVAAFGRR